MEGWARTTPSHHRGDAAVTEDHRTGDLHDDGPTDGPAGISWFSSYDRESVERFLAEVDAEKARLLAAIEEAERRTVVAMTRAAATHKAAQASLGALVLAAQEEISALEREHEVLVERIRSTAEAEASRLLAAATEEAAVMRESARSVSSFIDTSLADLAPGSPWERSTGGGSHVDVG